MLRCTVPLVLVVSVVYRSQVMSQARTIGHRFGFQRRFVIGETFGILFQVDSDFVVFFLTGLGFS